MCLARSTCGDILLLREKTRNSCREKVSLRYVLKQQITHIFELSSFKCPFFVRNCWPKPVFANLYIVLLPCRFDMEHHRRLRGKWELQWWYSPKHREGCENGEWAEHEWKVMPLPHALQVEAKFSGCKSALCFEIHYYSETFLYDFCHMTEVNARTGTKRSIKRMLHLHQWDCDDQKQCFAI